MPAEKIDHSLDTRIDKSNLQLEWMLQAERFQYWGEEQARIQKLRDHAKNHEALVLAQCAKKIRTNWKKYFETKPTEPAIKAESMVHKKYIKAQKNLIELNYRHTNATNMMRALEHKKRALEVLASFHFKGELGEPDIRKSKEMAESGKKKKK